MARRSSRRVVCVECASELPAADGAGPQVRYCSTACRRAAEHRITRLGRHLEYLERELSKVRVRDAGRPTIYASPEQGELRRQLTEKETALRALLDARSSRSPQPSEEDT